MSSELIVELSVPPGGDPQEGFECGVSAPSKEHLLKSVEEMEKNGLGITFSTSADSGYAVAFFHPLSDSGKEDRHLWCLVDKNTLRDLARKANFLSKELEEEERQIYGERGAPNSITYNISLPSTRGLGGIMGATVTYKDRSYVPPQGKLLTLNEGEFEVFMSTYDPLTDEADIQLGVGSYFPGGDTNQPIRAETYENFCDDMISLAQNHGWKLLGDPTTSPEHVRYLFV